MKASGLVFLATLLAALSPWTCWAAPALPGLHGKHPLSEPQVGEVLLGELRCAACHRRQDGPQPLDRSAPDLSDVGARVAPDYLQRFIAAPSAAHSGATMPDLLASETEERRNSIAEAITHFLVAQSPRRFQRQGAEKPDAAAGRALFHTIGCIACHSPRDEKGQAVTHEGVVELGHLPAKYSQASLTEFLLQPTRIRPAGRMPDMKLKSAEAGSLAGYLLGDQADATPPSLIPRSELVKLGEKYFRERNCAACHQLQAIPAAPAVVDLHDANPERGCLAQVPDKAPRFHFSDEQRSAVRAALAKRPEPPSAATRLAVTLVTFNCIACHVRDDFGGVSEERNAFFQSDAKNLGDDARIPPPLTLAGAKLQTVWMKKTLFDGESVRPYMFTRMPQFGEPNLRHVPDLFAALDHVDEFKMSLPNSESGSEQERNRAKEMREAGRKLLGNTSLNCVNCHNYNGKTPQNNGIELMTTPQRLKPSWFQHFLRSPNSYRPRIVMPVAWPDGQAVDKSVLDGNTERQIEAIWYFLTLGTSAPDPAGVQSVDSKLLVTAATRTYRGRSSVAGYRGIAVGFPEKLNYAFNAETGTLTALWRGDFVRVDRGGQGSGGFNPAGRHVGLAQDVSLFRLLDEQAPWPLRPVMTKEERVNPDPLYPKNRGYQFKGYYFDEASIPTFMYRTGEIAIEDRSHVGTGSDEGRLLRVLSFAAPQAETVWFRALTGKIEAESRQLFKTPELRLTVPGAHSLLRPLHADENTSELLLKLDIPAGNSILPLTYELLK